MRFLVGKTNGKTRRNGENPRENIGNTRGNGENPRKTMRTSGENGGLPVANVDITMERSTMFIHFYWENSVFLWPCSIAMLNYQRVPSGHRKIEMENQHFVRGDLQKMEHHHFVMGCYGYINYFCGHGFSRKLLVDQRVPWDFWRFCSRFFAV